MCLLTIQTIPGVRLGGRRTGGERTRRLLQYLYGPPSTTRICPRPVLTGQIYLAGEAFLQRMATLAKEKCDPLEVPRAQRRPQALPLSQHVAAYPDRKECMAQTYAMGDYTLAQVAQAFDVHYATVSRAVSGKRRR